MLNQIKSQFKFKNWFTYLAVVSSFTFFYYISLKTPLAGDDWGYAINGMNNNPFQLAYEFYFSWSGRFFSELYGFLVAPNKWFWNILNALLFSSIVYQVSKILPNKNKILALVLFLFLMVSVKDELRMETYTWIMGTTYVIPLALSLTNLNQLRIYILNHRRLNVLTWIFLIIFAFISGLMMENISFSMAIIYLLILVIKSFADQSLDIKLLFLTLSSWIALVLLRLSPGASARLLRDNPDWVKMGLFNQIGTNLPNLIKMTFIEHKYLILVLSLVFLIFLFQNTIKKRTIFLVQSSILVIALISSVSLTLSTIESFNFLIFFTDYTNLFNIIFWILYSLNVVWIIITLTKDNQRIILLILFVLALLSNAVMLVSPIFGYRSSIYTVIFMMVIAVYLVSLLNVKYNSIFIIVLSLLTLKEAYNLIEKYNLVHTVDQLRMEQITYYQKNPDVKDAWLIRYPVYTIHSGDIEDWDIYHMSVFKTYFGLEDDVILHFYFPPEGY